MTGLGHCRATTNKTDARGKSYLACKNPASRVIRQTYTSVAHTTERDVPVCGTHGAMFDKYGRVSTETRAR